MDRMKNGANGGTVKHLDLVLVEPLPFGIKLGTVHTPGSFKAKGKLKQLDVTHRRLTREGFPSRPRTSHESFSYGKQQPRIIHSGQGGTHFAEMTIYTGSGFRRFTPDRWDLEWGQLWDLPQATRDSRPGSRSRS